MSCLRIHGGLGGRHGNQIDGPRILYRHLPQRHKTATVDMGCEGYTLISYQGKLSAMDISLRIMLVSRLARGHE